MDYKPPKQRRGQGHVTHFKFLDPSHIYEITRCIVFIFCTLVSQAAPSVSFGMTNNPQTGYGLGLHEQFLNF